MSKGSHRDALCRLFHDNTIMLEPLAMELLLERDEPLKTARTVLDNLRDKPFLLTADTVLRLFDDTGQCIDDAASASVLKKGGGSLQSSGNDVGGLTSNCVLEPIIGRTSSSVTNSNAGTGNNADADSNVVTNSNAGTGNDVDADSDAGTDSNTVTSSNSSTGSGSDSSSSSVALKPSGLGLLPTREIEPDIVIEKDITSNSTCIGVISDFKLYFKSRYEQLRTMFRGRTAMGTVMPINRLRKFDPQTSFVGLITDSRSTKNGHKMLEVEDYTGSVKVLISKKSDMVRQDFVLDEVIGVVGNFIKPRPGENSFRSSSGESNDLFIAKNILRPGVQMRAPTTILEPLGALFISDIHVGSNTFMKDEFQRFLDWTNGKEPDMFPEELNRIRYLIISGDGVDGIGIYPGQENDLNIEDIYDQYKMLGEYLDQIPAHITIILQPGNHDAVRQAIPQPTFPEEIRNLLPERVMCVGNPCQFTLHGLRVLTCHGRGMDDLVPNLIGMTYTKAIEIMKEMLIRRHLAPIYGGKTPIAPEHKDYLVIDPLPDIFVTGHGHACNTGTYRGITLLNASTWQDQTSFQKMQAFEPDPCKALYVDLQTREVVEMDFSIDKDETCNASAA